MQTIYLIYQSHREIDYNYDQLMGITDDSGEAIVFANELWDSLMFDGEWDAHEILEGNLDWPYILHNINIDKSKVSLAWQLGYHVEEWFENWVSIIKFTGPAFSSPWNPSEDDVEE